MFNKIHNLRLYENIFCDLCHFRKTRTDDWVLRMGEMDDMRDLIVDIIRRHQY